MRTLSVILISSIVAACGGQATEGGSEPDPSVSVDPGSGSGSGSGPTCGEQEFKIERAIPDMLIVLDRSSSMSEGGSQSTWEISRSAIYDITAAMDKQIRFGLYVFPSGSSPYSCSGNDGCSAKPGALVPVGDANGAAIKSALASMQACGQGTPTASALAQAQAYLKSLPANGHTRAILLATDGGPNCNSGLNPQTCVCTSGYGSCWDSWDCLDDQTTYKALEGLCTGGIKTYVLGLGSMPSLTQVLSGMAQHGCSGAAHAANDAASVKKALQEITGGVASCSFQVDCTKIQDPYKVNFYFDGKVVTRTSSHQNGWDWTTACKKDSAGTGTVDFFGADCTAIKGQTVKTIGAKFGCATKLE
jgi:hypothetical protein